MSGASLSEAGHDTPALGCFRPKRFSVTAVTAGMRASSPQAHGVCPLRPGSAHGAGRPHSATLLGPERHSGSVTPAQLRHRDGKRLTFRGPRRPPDEGAGCPSIGTCSPVRARKPRVSRGMLSHGKDPRPVTGTGEAAPKPVKAGAGLRHESGSEGTDRGPDLQDRTRKVASQKRERNGGVCTPWSLQVWPPTPQFTNWSRCSMGGL